MAPSAQTNGYHNATPSTTPGILRVGLVGMGESRCHLRHFESSARVLLREVPHPKTYESHEDLCADPEVDVVFVLTSDEFHADQALTALKYNKHVLVEKPVSISIASAQRMLEAEKASQGKVFVAYMRRYSGALQTLLHELSTVKDIKFARVRDIIGPNSAFVDQSGTFPQRFTDFPAAANDKRILQADKLIREAYAGHSEITPLMTRFCRFLGGLGSHDLSVMREVLGMPNACTGVSMHPPFFTATFEYDDFAVCYESGIDIVPRFDAHLHIYGAEKTLKLQYDTP